jgi:murein DD-endopeptidase
VKTRHTLTIAVVVGGILCAQTVAAQTVQIPPSIEFRVPKPPTVAIGSNGAFVAYELHITNLTNAPMHVGLVEALDMSANAVLASMRDSVLRSSISRPGVSVPAPERTRIGGGLRAITYLWIPVDSARPPTAIKHRLTVQRDSGDTTLQVLEGPVVPVGRMSSTIGPPLRGEWMAANGPSNISGHRRLVLALNGNVASGQRFGIDFLQLNEQGTTHTGERTSNQNYVAYGKDILAVADGIVVATKDSIPENVPGGRAVAINLMTVAGNHVVIDIGDGRYAFYAHLIPGSLRVRAGDRVRRGQVIGRVGNSGNSTEPHLHFHVVDGIAPGTATLGAEGVPYAIEQFEVVGRCAALASGACERGSPVTVRRGIPLQNQVVRFPQ